MLTQLVPSGRGSVIATFVQVEVVVFVAVIVYENVCPGET